LLAGITTPDWVKDAIFYQIFPDRFARSQRVPKLPNMEPWDSPPTVHGFKGGDLLGVAEHLDYLVDLGITAIYLNPIFQSTANHRYHTYDYYRVDPLLGGNTAFRELLDAAHARGIRVILDGVFNHASRGFFQFNHILENGPASPYVDWFIVKGYPLYAYDEDRDPNYVCWWNLHALPKFNTANPAVRRFLWDVGRYWIEQGVDGWRLDVPGEIDDDEFWREFRRGVKGVNPEAYIVGEIWHDATRWLQGDQFDAVMNYLLAKACIGFFAGDTLDPALVAGIGYAPIPPLDAVSFADQVEHLLNLYHPQVTLAQFNLLDSHDTPRFLTLAKGDVRRLKLAILFLMTYPGAPCIFYGDEVGLQGGRDPDCRRSMPWDEARWDADLRDFVKRCIAIRKAHPALRRGEYLRLHADATRGVYAFLRRLDAEALVVVLNNGDTSYPVEVPLHGYLPDGAVLRDLLNGGEYRVTNDHLDGPALPPRSGMVCRMESCSMRWRKECLSWSNSQRDGMQNGELLNNSP